MEKIIQLKGVNFEWINPEEHGNMTGTQGGFIAQDIEKIFPDWIAKTDPQGKDKSLVSGEQVKNLGLPFEFDALLTEAIKEQQKEIETLKNTNRLLEQRLEAMEKQIEELKKK